MKTLNVTRKPGPYAQARDLEVFVDGAAVGTLAQGATLTVSVSDDAREMSGKVGSGKTEAFPISDLADGTDMVVWVWETKNPLRNWGFQTIPMKFDLPVD